MRGQRGRFGGCKPGHNLGAWREAPERSWQEEMWVLPALTFRTVVRCEGTGSGGSKSKLITPALPIAHVVRMIPGPL